MGPPSARAVHDEQLLAEIRRLPEANFGVCGVRTQEPAPAGAPNCDAFLAASSRELCRGRAAGRPRPPASRSTSCLSTNHAHGTECIRSERADAAGPCGRRRCRQGGYVRELDIPRDAPVPLELVHLVVRTVCPLPSSTLRGTAVAARPQVSCT
jgi:hypothetical protein